MAKTAKKPAAEKAPKADVTPKEPTTPTEVRPAPPVENVVAPQPTTEPDGVTPVKEAEVHTDVKTDEGGEHPDNGTHPHDGDALNQNQHIVPTFAEDLAPRKDESKPTGEKKQEAIDHAIKNPNGIGNEWPR